MNEPNSYVTEARIALMKLAREGVFEGSIPKVLERLLKVYSSDDLHWALSWHGTRQARLRKFRLGEEMVGPTEAFQQATNEEVAVYRATRFPAGTYVADLTCSIGGDLIALARRGPSMGIDIDDDRIGAAAWNLNVHGLTAKLALADCTGLDWDFDYAIADPSRRVDGRRTLNLREFAPDPLHLAGRMSRLKLCCIKLTPMLDDKWLSSFGGRLEFVSYCGSCCEASLWIGSDSGTGKVAVHIESGEVLESGEPGSRTESCQAYFYSVDAAAIRAHCLGELCRRFDLMEFVDSNGYLTGSRLVSSPWLSAFRVLYEGPGQPDKTRKMLAGMDAQTPVVLSRIARVEVEALRKFWSRNGSREVFVAVALDGKRLKHLILESP